MATPEHALMVALDIVDFSGRHQPGGKRPMDDHKDLQRGLYETFHEACERANLSPVGSDIEDRGDGLHVLFADPLEPARLVADLPRELATALDPYNRLRAAASRLRVRIAVHDGYVRREPYPWQGDSIIKLVRMLNCPAADAQMRKHPGQALALTISDSIYQAAVEEHQRGLKPDQFESISIQHDEHSRPFPAWLRIPAVDPRSPEAPAAEAGSPPQPANGPGARISSGNSGVTAMGDHSIATGESGAIHVSTPR